MRIAILTVFAVFTTLNAGSAQVCAAVGSERWTVKTTAPITTHARQIDLVAFGKLPTPTDIHGPHDKMLDTRYPTAIQAGLHEGDLVSVSGWVQKIKTSADDCDYHIEITPLKDGSSGLVIVEIPEPDAAHVADANLRGQLQALRSSLLTKLNLTGEPTMGGNKIGGRAYMSFTGALFFDGPHAPGCARGTGKASVTCWELHPVVAAEFAPRP